MRKLCAKDLFAAGRIVRDLDIREEMKEIAISKQDVEQKGSELVFLLFERVTTEKAERSIYSFLAGFDEGKKPEDIANMEAEQLLDYVLEIADPQTWMSFFSRLRNLLRTKSAS